MLAQTMLRLKELENLHPHVLEREGGNDFYWPTFKGREEEQTSLNSKIISLAFPLTKEVVFFKYSSLYTSFWPENLVLLLVMIAMNDF